MEQNTLLDRIIHSALGRIITAALQTFLVAQALLLVFVFRQVVDIEVLKYTIVVCVGLAAGFSARRLLQSQTRLLELLTALLAAAFSLAVQYSLTGGFIGILPFPGTSRYPAWESLIQLGAAALAAALVIFAFRTSQKSPPADPRPVQVSGGSSTPRESRRSWLPAFGRSAASRSTPAQPRGEVNRERTLTLSKVSLAPPPSAIKNPARKRRKRTSSEIHFIGEEEHTCPYCLESVEKGDLRGIKVCPICKTWHHADCWGITGACQIPHMHKN